MKQILFFLTNVFVMAGCVSLAQGDAVKSPEETIDYLKASLFSVTETRLENGYSEICVTDGQGNVKATYKINLSKHHHPATSADDPVIKQWEKWKFGAFLCFNSNQFTGNEFCEAKSPKVFDPPVLDVKQWISTFKAAGMTHAVLTVRHCSNFLLWDSATSDCDTANSAHKTDLVETYVAECRRQTIQPGIYYCLWGGARNSHPNARAIILAQLHELATHYGPIPYFWLDMHKWSPKDLSAQDIYDCLKNANPETVVMFNQHEQDGREIHYFPTDVLNGEMTLPPAEGHDPWRTVNGKKYYLPFETSFVSQTRPGHVSYPFFPNISWFTYGKCRGFTASQPYAPAKLYHFVQQAYNHSASSVLLACAPDHTGRMRDEDVKQLIELGRMLKDSPLTP